MFQAAHLVPLLDMQEAYCPYSSRVTTSPHTRARASKNSVLKRHFALVIPPHTPPPVEQISLFSGFQEHPQALPQEELYGRDAESNHGDMPSVPQHRAHDAMTLAERLTSREELLEDEAVGCFVAWAGMQHTTSKEEADNNLLRYRR